MKYNDILALDRIFYREVLQGMRSSRRSLAAVESDLCILFYLERFPLQLVLNMHFISYCIL